MGQLCGPRPGQPRRIWALKGRSVHTRLRQVMEDHLAEAGSWVELRLPPRTFQKGAKEP